MKRNQEKGKFKKNLFVSTEEQVIIKSKEFVKKTVQTKNSSHSFVSPVKMKVVKTHGPPVRTKKERKKLDGFTCKQCEDYYRSKNLSEEELKTKLKACSRHRSTFSPPKSPEHFWETDMPSTPECIRRGYIKIAPNKRDKSDKPDNTDITSL